MSNIGPKTSWAARDKPELDPRKQTSRHDIAGASPDGGRHHKNHARRKATHSRDKRDAPMRHRALCMAHSLCTTICASPHNHCATLLADRAIMCAKLATIGRPFSGQLSAVERGKRAIIARACAHGEGEGAPPCAAVPRPITSIRSMTGRETPSSACTRRPDEISVDGFSSSSWPEQIPAKQGGGGGGARRRLLRRGGGRRLAH
ncbi:hypothetical protein F511_36350 [Dorcoceras hygrometricum]|uniref:Uncharacterized protein n=1 Tax=Dorcoceras hygrometricum TaxID=472368 RepID=A0A2Z7C8J6_9LAMI|nr:hypothetical protein F511_36350 [Dorcoceras hygrometricum]